MMADEDDYLSDKFLVEAIPSRPATYAERRRQAERASTAKSEQNRKRSRKELETAAREEGLSKSLFQRAAEEQNASSSSSGGNKAMSMMLKMGFKPGQSLGQSDPGLVGPVELAPDSASTQPTASASTHRIEPIPIRIWSGKDGLGRKKRALSPSAANVDAQPNSEDFRSRSRLGYEERRNLGRLMSAVKTCMSLDEHLGIEFNYLWLNPQDQSSFPEGLIEALEDPSQDVPLSRSIAGHSREVAVSCLSEQIKADKFDAVPDWDSTVVDAPPAFLSSPAAFSLETISNAKRYCLLPISECLTELVAYLRKKHFYCFWCGTKYTNQEEMDEQCPGDDENAHD